MPVIEMKANVPVRPEQKAEIAAGFAKAFEAAGEPVVAGNILVEIDGERWISFRGNAEAPAAVVTIHPGPMTPKEDYAPIVAGFFETLKAVLPEIPQDRIYMTLSEIKSWGWDGKLL